MGFDGSAFTGIFFACRCSAVVVSRRPAWSAIYRRQYLVVPTDRERAYRHHAHCWSDVDGPAYRSLWAFGYDVLSISPLRLFGALIVLGATAVVLDIGRGRLWEGHAQGLAAWVWRGFGVAIGMGSATQTAVNGRLGAIIGSPIHAGLLSLAVGVAVLFILSLVLPGRSRVFRPIPAGPWWKWLGGVLGAFFVVGGALFAPILGTGLMVIAALSGTITAGQLLETRGWIGAPKRRLTVRRVCGLVGIFLGVVVVRMN